MGDVLRTILWPIIYLMGFVVVGGYQLLFGWWLDPLAGRKLDRLLAEEIREKLSFLFTTHGARIVPTQGPLRRSFDGAYATIEMENLRLRFVTGRGDLTVEVAPQHERTDWHELSLVAMVVETPQGIGSREKIRWLEDVAKLLQAHWDALNNALSVKQYRIIRKRLEAIYDLPADALWQSGISVPLRLRTDERAPLPSSKNRR